MSSGGFSTKNQPAQPPAFLVFFYSFPRLAGFTTLFQVKKNVVIINATPFSCLLSAPPCGTFSPCVPRLASAKKPSAQRSLGGSAASFSRRRSLKLTRKIPTPLGFVCDGAVSAQPSCAQWLVLLSQSRSSFLCKPAPLMQTHRIFFSTEPKGSEKSPYLYAVNVH